MTLTGLKWLLKMNEQTNFSLPCVCLAGLVDHCSSSLQTGHLLWHAHEQGSAWWLPQEEKAAIARRCRLKGNDEPRPKCPFLSVCLVWVWMPDFCISVWVVLCRGFCIESLLRQTSWCSCKNYWPQWSHWRVEWCSSNWAFKLVSFSFGLWDLGMGV